MEPAQDARVYKLATTRLRDSRQLPPAATVVHSPVQDYSQLQGRQEIEEDAHPALRRLALQYDEPGYVQGHFYR